MHNIVRRSFNIIITVLFCPQLSINFGTIHRNVLEFYGKSTRKEDVYADYNSSGCGKVER